MTTKNRTKARKSSVDVIAKLSTDEKGEPHNQIHADGGLLTGAALVGGAKLIYEVGKDLYVRLKKGKRVFCQVIDSCYHAAQKQHRVRIRIASAYLHGIYIESISSEAIKHSSIQIFSIHIPPKISMSNVPQLPITFPVHLSPSDSLDFEISFPEITDLVSTKNEGLQLIFRYVLLDKLGDQEESIETIRLRWS
ncbi:hypothetical protein [Rheinheimera soli]|uniref:hypothetical protein n=1 Tax=Rheinheimera soli TaxID=443616 RepID=UPI001E4064ED|nr:hypothetical protein [Rheinheimera soli]